MEYIGCMKLSAICGRAVVRDYIDLYVILQNMSLKELLLHCSKKYPSLNKMIILKSLSYFDDVTGSKVHFKKGHEIAWTRVKSYLAETVKRYLKQIEKEEKHKRG